MSNSFSALTAVSFATDSERLGTAVSEGGGKAIGVGAATEVARLYAVSDAVSVVERSATSLARVGLGIRVEGRCWTRLGFDEEGCDPGGLFFPGFLNIEDIFGDMNLGMMVQNSFEFKRFSALATAYSTRDQPVTSGIGRPYVSV